MSLSSYRSKRSFDSTPEPKPTAKKSRSKKLAFVMQKHQASQLHYDLRLELGGVLKSWAVPKGPSLNPHDHHLAIMVEDHPYEYRKFEGVIPKGNYGAGNVIIWDQGSYEPRTPTKDPEKSIAADIKKGHLTFILHGQKLKGEFALIRSPKIGKKSWLLIKKGDQFASTKDVTTNDTSVVSGEQVEEVDAMQKQDFKSAPKTAMPRGVTPMLAKLVKEPFDNPAWIYEIKWDGFRAIASWDGRSAQLYSRNGLDFSEKFPPVFEALHNLKHKVVLDGEVVAIDKNGLAHFEWLQDYKNLPGGKLVYYVFDMLWYDGRDLTGWPLTERKRMLKSALPKSDIVRYSDEATAKGTAFFKQAQKQHLEGIMAKKSASTYHLGKRTGDWLKIKTHLQQEVVIAGFTEPRGSRQDFGALLLAVYDNGKLTYIGSVGTGFSSELLSKMRTTFRRYERKASPFDQVIKLPGKLHWLKPELVGEVRFAEWTRDGKVRQAAFLGLRPDKPARDVVRELPMSSAKVNKTKPSLNDIKTKVELTHLDKVFWPEAGLTKGDLINYYAEVADYILPYLKGRPESMLRQPNGYKGEAFFQKDVGDMPPSWVKTKRIHSDSTNQDISYIICDERDTLLYMAQLGCIEINPWNSRLPHLSKPDWAVVDLDPEGVEFATVVKVATVVKQVCDELKIPSYPKTSGKTGIHIFVPLGAKYSYDQAKQFAQLLVTLVHERLPQITSLERSPAKRQHKVYLDFLQNRGGQTLAAPYCARPTAAASVSAPLHWSEVNARLKPQNFTMKNIMIRLKKEGDLWKPVLGKGVDLAKLIKTLAEAQSAEKI